MLYKSAQAAMTCIALTIASAVQGATASPPYYERIQADWPFTDPDAIKHIKEVLGDDLEQATEVLLKDVVSYAYEFVPTLQACPFSEPTECKPGQWAEVSRILTLDGSKLTKAIQDEVASYERGGCDFVELRRNRLVSVQPKKLTYTGHIYARDRACGFLGTHVLGTAEGDWTLDIVMKASMTAPRVPIDPLACRQLRTTKETQTKDTTAPATVDKWGAVTVTHQFDRSIDHDVLGFLDLDTTIGRMFDDILLRFKLSPLRWLIKIFGGESPTESSRDLMKTVRNVLNSEKVTALQIADKSIGAHRRFACEIEIYEQDYRLDPKETYFKGVQGKSGAFHVQIKETAILPSRLLPLYYRSKIQEIENMKSWKEKDHMHIARAGDGLWSIAERQYGTGKAWLFLLHSNPNLQSRATHLYLNDTIHVPARWRLLQAQRNGGLVLVGDSMWSHFIADKSLTKWNPTLMPPPTGSTSVDLIYPYQFITQKHLAAQ